MKIGLTYDLREDWPLAEGEPQDANAEFDKPATIEQLEEAFCAGGHETLRIGNVQRLMAQIEDLDIDIIFNICEGQNGRTRESEVPVLLDMHAIPYVGSDGLTLGMTLDKSIAKQCFVVAGIPTPRYFVAEHSRDLGQQNHIGFPLFVKPVWEGTSKSLTELSRVNDEEGLKRQIDLINKTYNQPALVEEFIAGREFTVAVLGNNPPQAMPIVQVSIDGDVNLGERFYTYELVSSDTLRYICPAMIPETLAQTMQDLAVRAYKTLGCRDVGRVDFRVDDDGNPYVLEINPLPSFEKQDVFNLFPQVIGSTYEKTMNQILHYALDRYGMNGKMIVGDEREESCSLGSVRD